MADNISGGTVKSIDTKDFEAVIASFKQAIITYRGARERVFNSTEKLLSVWVGEGKDAFEKEYDPLKTRLTDEEDNLNTIKEDLEDCLRSYVDWDTNLSAQFKKPTGNG